jgi:hypothetical protein
VWGPFQERTPLRLPRQSGGARGLSSAAAGGMTGWRRCYEDLDGPVATGPYQGRLVRQWRDGDARVRQWRDGDARGAAVARR